MKNENVNAVGHVMTEVYGSIECEAAEKVHSILNALQSAGDIVILPKEPTEAMMQAGFDIDEEGMDAVAIYKTMLAASNQEGK